MSFKKSQTRKPSRLGEKAPKENETNLYLCKADILLPSSEISATRKRLGDILTHVDPGWKFIRIQDCENYNLNIKDGEYLKTMNQNYNKETSVQTLSVIIFLHEEHYQEVLETIHKETDVWQLRHTIHLLNNNDSSTVIGCMDFYEHSTDLPLWVICPVHFGNKILRFNLFVKDFEWMKEYYEKLISQECNIVRKGFCIFKVHSYPGLEIQISLKRELNTELCHTKSAVLRLKFRKLDVTRCNLVSALKQIKPHVWRTKDPEGNVILLEEVNYESQGKLTKRRSKSEDINDELVFV